MAECRKLLLATSAESFKTPHPVLAIKDTATVADALKVLADARILSAPVITPPRGSCSESGGDLDASQSPVWVTTKPPEDIIGFIDVRDVVSSFLEEIKPEELAGCRSLLQRMRVLEQKGSVFAQSQIKNLSNIGLDGDFLHSTQAKISLMELVSMGMLQPKLRAMHGGDTVSHVVHRIALFNNQGAITDVISQSDVIRFLVDHADDMGSLGSTTLAELGFANKNVECIPPTTCALEAMQRMLEKKVSSLAVVGVDGKIMGNFSVSELRSIMADQFGALALPVSDFLAFEHGIEYVGHNHHNGPPRKSMDVANVGDAPPAVIAGIAAATGVDTPSGTTLAAVEEAVASASNGTDEDADVAKTAGHRFVADYQARRPLPMAGEECGQMLALARPSTTLVEAMSKMAKQRVHRVYVVNDDLKPVGVVTCTDVLRTVVAWAN